MGTACGSPGAITIPSLLARADTEEPSIFRPEAMLRETRRQRHLPPGSVPAVCVLDPDGDIVRQLQRAGRAQPSASWACYHSTLWETADEDGPLGIVGGAVGAPYAVLVAEQLFASGCALLISITSAGQLESQWPPSGVVLIERALRGEGTSHAYLPPAPIVAAPAALITAVACAVRETAVPVTRGMSWTTDAPYRETATALAHAHAQGATVVEMEAAALYAFAAAHQRPVVCFAHVTNTMAVTEGDFDKGPADGVAQALTLVTATRRAWRHLGQS
jgi:uridine phosphorylase